MMAVTMCVLFLFLLFQVYFPTQIASRLLGQSFLFCVFLHLFWLPLPASRRIESSLLLLRQFFFLFLFFFWGVGVGICKMDRMLHTKLEVIYLQKNKYLCLWKANIFLSFFVCVSFSTSQGQRNRSSLIGYSVFGSWIYTPACLRITNFQVIFVFFLPLMYYCLLSS